MTQDTHKTKTLSLNKPLSLAKEAEIFKTFGKEVTKVITENSFYSPKQAIFSFKSKDQKQDPTKLEIAKDQISNKIESQQDKIGIKHKKKEQTPDCFAIKKDRDMNKDKMQKQVSSKLSSQEEKAARREVEKQRHKRRQEALTWLRDTFPACFNLDSPQPLKIGIFDDILHILDKRDPKNLINSPTRMSLRKAIRYYIENHPYHKAILTSPHRYDLEGNIAQDVTDQDRDHAKARLEFLETQYKKWQENKKLNKKV